MAEPGSRQAVWRRRVEVLIGLAAPALDLMLAAGDRLSRIVEPQDHGHYAVRSAADPSLPPDFGAPPAAAGASRSSPGGE